MLYNAWLADAGLASTLIARPLQETAEGRGLSWIWIVVIVVLVLLIAWWGYRSSRQSADQQAEPLQSSGRAAPVETQGPPPVPDDLVIIEGIGPKIAGLLQAAGIITFAQLAQTDPARLEEILRGANLRLADPATWPEQARLAAAGDREGLQALQARLKGGRAGPAA